MAITHRPGVEPGKGGHGHQRAAVLSVAALVSAAIVLPFAAAHLLAGRANVEGLPEPTIPVRHHEADSTVDSLGPRHHLPQMLPARATVLSQGLSVRVGNLTEGRLRLTGSGWHVVVRWGGRAQPLKTQGAVGLGGHTSWVSAEGDLYTRVATSTLDRFRVYEWRPTGGSAYVPPTLLAKYLGVVCFDPSFTAFGDCASS